MLCVCEQSRQTKGAKGKKIIHYELHGEENVGIDQKLQDAVGDTGQQSGPESEKVTGKTNDEHGQQRGGTTPGEVDDLDLR